MALIAIGALGVVAIGVEDSLRPTSIAIPGTESAPGQELQERYFAVRPVRWVAHDVRGR